MGDRRGLAPVNTGAGKSMRAKRLDPRPLEVEL